MKTTDPLYDALSLQSSPFSKGAKRTKKNPTDTNKTPTAGARDDGPRKSARTAQTESSIVERSLTSPKALAFDCLITPLDSKQMRNALVSAVPPSTSARLRECRACQSLSDSVCGSCGALAGP